MEEAIIYDYKESRVEDVIEELSYFDLFGNKKVVVLKDADFLTSKSTLESSVFDNYLVNPNKDSVLVLKMVCDKLDERKKLVKSLKDKAVIKEFKSLLDKDINGYVKNYFTSHGYKINEEALEEITRRLRSNTRVIDSELEKLFLYKINDKLITKQDVEQVITLYEENNMFELVNAVLKKDKKQIFNLYKKLIEDREEPNVILVMIANQFRLMYQAKVLMKEGLDKYKIANMLKEHHYRVGLSLENAINIEEEDLLKILHKLSLVDIQIKTGVNDSVKALETFFLEL